MFSVYTPCINRPYHQGMHAGDVVVYQVKFFSSKYKQVYNQLSPVLYQCIPCYRTVPPWTDISRYIPPCTTCHDSGEHMNSKLESVCKRLHFASLCLLLCKLHPASNSCVPLNRDRLYKVVCTVKCRFKAVLYDSMVCTKYVQDLLWMIECMYMVCGTGTNWEVHLVLWTTYARVCAEYIRVRTVFVPACTWYVHVHTCFYLYTSVVST